MPKQAFIPTFLPFFLLFLIQLKAQNFNVELEKVKTIRGLTAILRNNPADSTCRLLTYNLLVMPLNGTPFKIKAAGPSEVVAGLRADLTRLQVGDTLYFFEALTQCKSEPAAREVRNITLTLR